MFHHLLLFQSKAYWLFEIYYHRVEHFGNVKSYSKFTRPNLYRKSMASWLLVTLYLFDRV